MPKTLLLADDSVTIQKVVGISFANEDIVLLTVDNGDDALAKAREARPDIILADVVMPGMNGYEVCEAIRAEPDLADTPVLLLTGTFEAFDEDRAARVRADGHITKPFEAQSLVDEVNRLLARPEASEAPVGEAPVGEAAASEPAATAGDPLAHAASLGLTSVRPGASASGEAYDFFDEENTEPGHPSEAQDASDAGVLVGASPEPSADPLLFDAPGESRGAMGFDSSSDLNAFDDPGPGHDATAARPLAGEAPSSPGYQAPAAEAAPAAEEAWPTGSTSSGSDWGEPEDLSAEAVDPQGDTTLVTEEPLAPPSPVSFATPGPATRDGATSQPLLGHVGDDGATHLFSEDEEAAPSPAETQLLGDAYDASGVVASGPVGLVSPTPLDPPTPPPYDVSEAVAVAPPQEPEPTQAPLVDAEQDWSDLDVQASSGPDSVLDPSTGRGYDVSSSDLSPASDVLQPLEDLTAVQDAADASGVGVQSEPEPAAPVYAAAESGIGETDDELAGYVEDTEEALAVPVHEPLLASEPEPEVATLEVAAAAPGFPSQELRGEIHQAIERIAWEAFGQLTETLVRDVVEKVERVAWEVVPQMTEALLQEEIRKLKEEEE